MTELLQMLPEGPEVQDRGAIFSDGSCLPFSPARARRVNGVDGRDQLALIIRVLGTPSDALVESLDHKDARRRLQGFAAFDGEGFSGRFPYINPDSLDLLSRMLVFDSKQRIPVDEALGHPLFASSRDPARETVAPSHIAFDLVEPSDALDEDCFGQNFIELICKIKGCPQFGALGGA
jgi:serine/threonine protein kinase